MSLEFKFDPPLCIPGNGTAEFLAGDLSSQGDSCQAHFCRVIVKTGIGEVVGDGLYQRDESSQGIYRLVKGNAYKPQKGKA